MVLFIYNFFKGVQFSIHWTLFTNLRNFWNTLGNLINFLLLESRGCVEQQYNFFVKKGKSEIEKKEDDNFKLFM